MQRSKMCLHDVKRDLLYIRCLFYCETLIWFEYTLHEADEPTGSGGSAQGGI